MDQKLFADSSSCVYVSVASFFLYGNGGEKAQHGREKKILSRKRNSLRALLSLVPVGKFVSRMTKEEFNFGEIELNLPSIFCVWGECKKGSPQFPRRKAEDGKLSPSPYLLRKKW